MKEDEELEMLLDEIPHATSLNLLHYPTVHGGSIPSQRIHDGVFGDDLSCYYRNYMCFSCLHSEGSSSGSGSGSGSLSGGLSSSDDGSTTPPETKSSRDVYFTNGLWLDSKFHGSSTAVKNSDDSHIDELGLIGYLRRMNIRDVEKDSSTETFKVETPHRLHFDEYSSIGENGYFEDYNRKQFFNYGGLQSSAARVGHTSFDDETRSALFRLEREEAKMCNLLGSNPSPGLLQEEGLFSGPVQADSAFGINCYDRGNGMHSVTKDFSNYAFLYSQTNGMHSNRDRVLLNSISPSSQLLTDPKLALDARNLSRYYSLPMFSEKVAALPNSWVNPHVLPSVTSSPNFEGFNCEDSSLIIQGKGLNYVINKGTGDRDRSRSRVHKKVSCNDISRGRQAQETGFGGRSPSPSFKCKNDLSSKIFCPFILPTKFNSLMEVQGYIYFIAKDQHGCRFLQRKFDEGTAEDVEMIFIEIIEHVFELMMNPFGNYLMQKLLDVCTEEQRMEILFMVTEEPGQLVKIALNTHGTRAVQKLIETLKTKKQISMVISALEPGFLDLINDLNGNHVVQCCLQCLSNEDNKFIFKAAAKYCVHIATHRHGCCVLQRCIAHSTGEHREKLVTQISTNGLRLAQDSFGNYVVQFVLELKIPTATAKLISQFEGNYVHMSIQKFSSNVVEKCLKVFREENRSRIILELLSYSHFEQLLQDPFANYVIQSALGVTKGSLHASLVEAIRPHAAILRTSPYCKRIFSRTHLKK